MFSVLPISRLLATALAEALVGPQSEQTVGESVELHDSEQTGARADGDRAKLLESALHAQLRGRPYRHKQSQKYKNDGPALSSPPHHFLRGIFDKFLDAGGYL